MLALIKCIANSSRLSCASHLSIIAILDLPALLGVVKGVTSSEPTNHRLAGSRCARMRRRLYKRRRGGQRDYGMLQTVKQ